VNSSERISPPDPLAQLTMPRKTNVSAAKSDVCEGVKIDAGDTAQATDLSGRKHRLPRSRGVAEHEAPLMVCARSDEASCAIGANAFSRAPTNARVAFSRCPNWR
jgi:hypothetical protein